MIDSQDLLHFAEDQQPCDEECVRRAKMSRAYYGVYHRARKSLYPNNGPEDYISHETVEAKLNSIVNSHKNMQYQIAATWFKELKRGRVKADYHIHKPIHDLDVQKHLERARLVYDSIP